MWKNWSRRSTYLHGIGFLEGMAVHLVLIMSGWWNHFSVGAALTFYVGIFFGKDFWFVFSFPLSHLFEEVGFVGCSVGFGLSSL